MNALRVREFGDGFERVWMEAFLRLSGYWSAACDRYHEDLLISSQSLSEMTILSLSWYPFILRRNVQFGIRTLHCESPGT